MTIPDLSPLANHLWQSTFFGAAMWLLTLALRKNRAAVRYWLWLAASVKFLIPFSLLVSMGSQLGRRSAPVITPPHIPIVVSAISRPFVVSVEALPAAGPQAHNPLPMILLGVWLCGFTLGLIFWLRSLRRIRAVERAAKPLLLDLPIPVKSSPARLEPGVFGVRNPVLILPEGITERLTPGQLEAVLAHELCHVRRRDNLTAAVHMLVELIFWFHPLVWWIRTRLVAERERACDEEVVRAAGDPQVYAEGILNVCKFYLESPVACVSGVTGADLKRRIAEIMARRAGHRLSYGKRILLAAVGLVAITGPVVIGTMYGQSGEAPLQFEVASIKPFSFRPPGPLHTGMRGGPGSNDPGRFIAENKTLSELVIRAYDLKPFELSGPLWMHEERWVIEAKVPPGATVEQFRAMLQNLLAARFGLKVHREVKEMPIYELAVGKNGPKLKESAPEPANDQDQPGLPWDSRGHTTLDKDGFPVLPPSNTPMTVSVGQKFASRANNQTAEELALMVSGWAGRPVKDRTGLKGKYDYTLRWIAEGDDGPDLFAAVQRQLGLKLVSTKGPVEILVVDHAEKTPTEN